MSARFSSCNAIDFRFIALSESDPLGCRECFCFGMTTNCTELLLPKVQLRDMDGWQLTDHGQYRTLDVNYTDGALTLDSTNSEVGVAAEVAPLQQSRVQHAHMVYWAAPSVYKGNLLTSYGGSLKFFVYLVAQESQVSSSCC